MQRSGEFTGRSTVGVLAVLSVVALVAAPAHAAFPGANGKIAFGPAGGSDLYTMNADGSGRTPVTSGSSPAWSPDGKKIAFSYLASTGEDDIGVVNADGTGLTNLTPSSGFENRYPAWSPDGSKIVFSREPLSGPLFDLYVMNANGTGVTKLTNSTSRSDEPLYPAWSPDGKKIAFSRPGRGCIGGGCPQIYTIHPDGSALTDLSNDTTMFDSVPKWSPDGTRMIFTRLAPDALGPEPDVAAMNSDGTGIDRIACCGYSADWSPDGARIVMNNAFAGIETRNPDGTDSNVVDPNESVSAVVDWQPLPINTYPRPKGATPFQTYLTVAYKPCPVGGNNRQHGAPLAVDSCSPPVQASDYLTVGTFDSNDQQAKAVGVVRADVHPGNAATPANEADVNLFVSLKDVRNKSDLSDYGGELVALLDLRITDKENSPSPGGQGAGTTQDFPFPITDPCSVTSDTSIGSLCELSTSANAIIGGSVKEQKRAIWQLGQIQVYDGGSDQDADTTGDNTRFMDEGVFVP